MCPEDNYSLWTNKYFIGKIYLLCVNKLISCAHKNITTFTEVIDEGRGIKTVFKTFFKWWIFIHLFWPNICCLSQFGFAILCLCHQTLGQTEQDLKMSSWPLGNCEGLFIDFLTFHGQIFFWQINYLQPQCLISRCLRLEGYKYEPC